jgi:signal transduction histidine kinase
MRHHARWAFMLALIARMMVCPSAVAQPHAPRNVLTIHWGSEDFPGTPALDGAIREELESNAATPINYFAEYLESEAFPSSPLALREYIRQKYAGRRIDVVIANTTPALEFVLSCRSELFPDVPIVFLAGTLGPPRNVKVSGITGLVSDVAFAETVELALRLHPSVRQVFVVAQSPTDDAYGYRVLATLRQFSNRVQLTYITETSVPRLLAAIKTLPPRSLILYTRFSPDNSDSVSNTVEVGRLMAQTSPVPIYSTTTLYMGTGVVGGIMRESRETGARIGRIARRVLDGTRPEDIPVEKVKRVPTFDWRQVQRWGIDAARLPAGSIIQFRTPTVWESHRPTIITGGIVIVTQTLLIIALLTERASRRRAERTIRSREATLRASYEKIQQLAGRVINAQDGVRADIARDLHDDVCQRLVSVSMVVSGLKSSPGQIESAQTQRIFAELEYEIGGVFDGIRRLSHELHPASLRLLGLVPALKTHCKEVEKRHDVQVSFETDGDLARLDADVGVCFFRIVQEALRNGVVHGRARHLTVSLVRSDEHVEVTVSDDGRGFDLEAVRRNGGGLGLVSMEERARVLGGSVHIVSALGEGTRVAAKGPAVPADPSRRADVEFSSDKTAHERFQVTEST